MLDDNAFSEHETESASWIALADLMTGLMAIFLILCLLAMTNQDRTRVMIVQTVEDTMQAENIKVDVDAKTGDISIADNILFAMGSAQLSNEGKAFLRGFIPVYSSILFEKLSEEQLEQVARIAVEGHTSLLGGYTSNMRLSLERAHAVVQFIDQEMAPFPHKDRLKRKITPVGRGLLDAQNFETGKDRKVVFKFQFASELFSTTKDDLLQAQSKTVTSAGTTQVFSSPHLSVFCAFFTPNDGQGSSVRCYSDEKSGMNYQKLAKNCQKNLAFNLNAVGAVQVQCNPDDAIQQLIQQTWSSRQHVLPDNEMIVVDGISCLSRNIGMTCTHPSGNGFFVSRTVQDTFGAN